MSTHHACAVAVLLLPALAGATGLPVTLATSGYALDGTDTPVDQPAVALGFSVWTDATATGAGARAWPASGESACVADVKGGYYAVVLDGAGSGCGAGLTTDHVPAGVPRWLQVTFAGVTLLPRQPLGSAPTASLATQSEDTQALIAALAAPGTLNAPANPVDWTRLKGVPAGLATLSSSGALPLSAGGTGLLAGAANQIPGMNAAATAAEWKSITGTANRVTVTQGAGTITLSTPQDLHAAATPTFASVTLGGAPTTGLQAATKDYVDTHGGVTSFQGRTGAITLAGADVTTALGYTPANRAGDTLTGTLTLSPASGAALVTTAGNVGIGTTSPGIQQTIAGRTYLTIVGPSNAGVLETATNEADGDNVRLGQIQFTDRNSTATNKSAATIAAALDGATANNRGGRLEFYTKADGASVGTERLRITGSGLVGIGTTVPMDRLQVGVNTTTTAGLGEYGGANLILNGGAEPNSTLYWTSTDFGVDGTVGSGQVASGGTATFSGNYTFLANNDGGLKQTVRLAPDAVYTYSLRMRVVPANNTGDAAAGYLVVQTVGGTRDLVDSHCQPNTFDVSPTLYQWMLCSVTFKAPAAPDQATVDVEVGFRAAGSTHSVYVDDVRLVKGGLAGGSSPYGYNAKSGQAIVGGALEATDVRKNNNGLWTRTLKRDQSGQVPNFRLLSFDMTVNAASSAVGVGVRVTVASALGGAATYDCGASGYYTTSVQFSPVGNTAAADCTLVKQFRASPTIPAPRLYWSVTGNAADLWMVPSQVAYSGHVFEVTAIGRANDVIWDANAN